MLYLPDWIKSKQSKNIIVSYVDAANKYMAVAKSVTWYAPVAEARQGGAVAYRDGTQRYLVLR